MSYPYFRFYSKTIINQCESLEQELNSFLKIKRENNYYKRWLFRFFYYISRPLRFLYRVFLAFINWLISLVKKAFRMMFLLPPKEKQLDMDDPNGNVLLIKGEWGVGKTYLVDRYFKSNLQAGERYNPVFIDLFGLSSIDELNKKVVKGISFSKTKKKEKTIKIYAKATIENKFSGLAASLEIGIALSKKIEKIRNYNDFVENQNAIYKKCRYRHIKEPVIILDDIERKNKELSLESILGFVDIFKKQGIKTILIANATQLELQEEEMYHLLDRVADRTCFIYDIKNSIDDFIEYFQVERRLELGKPIDHIFSKEAARILILKDLTSNLRTFKRFAGILVDFDRDFDYPDRPLLNMILLCLISQCEGKYLFNDLISSKTEEHMKLLKTQGEDKSYPAAYNEMLEKYSHLKNDRFQTFYLQAADVLERFKVFKGDKGRGFVNTVYDCLYKGTIEDLRKSSFKFQLCPLQNVIENRGEAGVPKNGFKTANSFASFVEGCIHNKGVSKFYLLLFVCQTCDYNHFKETEKTVNKHLKSFSDDLIKEAISEYVLSGWEYETHYLRYVDPKDSGIFSSKDFLKRFFEGIAPFINENLRRISIEERLNVLYRIEDIFQVHDASMIDACYMGIKDKFYEDIISFNKGEFVDNLTSILSRRGNEIKERVLNIVGRLERTGRISNIHIHFDDFNLDSFMVHAG